MGFTRLKTDHLNKVNARKNSEIKIKTALAFTPGYAVYQIAFNSRNKPHNTLDLLQKYSIIEE